MREGTRVVLPIVRPSDSDLSLAIAFDLETLTWGEPFRFSTTRDCTG